MGADCCGASEDITHAKSKEQREKEVAAKGIMSRNSVQSQNTQNDTPGQPEPSQGQGRESQQVPLDSMNEKA